MVTRTRLPKFLCLLAFSWLYTSIAYGQETTRGPQAKIDSLMVRLSTQELQDTTYVNILNQLGYEYWTVSPVFALDFGRTALSLSESLDYAKGLAFANRVIGVAHWVQGDYSHALERLIASKEGYESLGDTLGIANCTMNIGLVYSDQSNNDRALSNFFEAIKMFERLHHMDRVATTYTKIGSVYTDQGQYQQALEYFTKALEIHEKNHFLYGISEVNNRIGIMFAAQKEYRLALEYCERSLELSHQIGDQDGITNNLEVMGRVYLMRGQFARAKELLLEAEEHAKSIEATKYLRDIYRDLRDLHYQQGHYPTAFSYYEQFETLKDSIFNGEVSAKMADLQTSQELAVQQKELAMARMERDMLNAEADYQRDQRNMLIIVLVLGALLSVITVIAMRTRIKKQQELLRQRKELNRTRENLQQVELENAQLKASELQRELDYKNRELTSYTLNFAQKNQLIEDLKEQLAELKPSDAQQQKQVKQLRSLVNNTRNVDRDWEDFRLHFEQVHPHFFQALKRKHGDLSNGEQKLCALVRLNLSMKETAAILGISPNSVKTARYRLRNKLELKTEDNLMDYLMQFEEKQSQAVS